MNNPHSRNANAVAVTKTAHAEKPLKHCKCGTGTNNNECAWCRIVGKVGYDMSMLREGMDSGN